ncbi:MAG: YesL family protein [Lachnospiraceae bacterium]|nr:YesL family protein [Lachnospiraceae bacterium]
MNGMFSPDRGIGRVLTKIGELVILSILWFVTSLPIITIGVSTTALYYSTVKSLRRERGYFVKEYFRAWKENFLRSSFLMVFFILCILGLLTVLVMNGFTIEDALTDDIKSIFSEKPDGAVRVFIIVGVVLFILLALFSYVFPLVSRLEQKGAFLLLLGFTMMVRFFYYSIAIAVILVALAGAVIQVPMAIMFAPGLWALLSSFLLEKAFRKYVPAPEADPDVDAWWTEL